MTAAKQVTATFDAVRNPLSVALAGTGTGQVASRPAGIACPAGACSASYITGTAVTLTATPAIASTFAGWTGSCAGTGACPLTMSAARQVTAIFNAVSSKRQLYLPCLNNPAFPDLIVQSIAAGGNTIRVVIKNIGQAPVVDAFWVDAYIDPHPAPTAVNPIWYDGRSAQGVVWGVTGAALPIPPGGTVTLTYGDQYDGGAPYTYLVTPLKPGTPVWAQVDSWDASTWYGAVLESHEFYHGRYDNILGPVYATAAMAGPAGTPPAASSQGHAGWDQLPARPSR
jgi:hypothetical protein